jgi:hypothetical protein
MPDAHTPAPDVYPSDTGHSVETLKLVVSWLWVGVPAAWGVYHVVVDALKLFR